MVGNLSKTVARVVLIPRTLRTLCHISCSTHTSTATNPVNGLLDGPTAWKGGTQISTSGTLPPRSCNSYDQSQRSVIRFDLPSRFIRFRHGPQNANNSRSSAHVNNLPSAVLYLSRWPSILTCSNILVISAFPVVSLSCQSLLIGTAILQSQPMMGQCCPTRRAYRAWNMSN